MKNLNSNCPLCGKTKFFNIKEYSTNKIIKGYKNINVDVSKYFKGINKIKKLQCRNCNIIYYNHHIEGDGRFYADLNKNHRYYDPDRIEFSLTKDYIKEYNINTLLEIGCGDGYFLDKVKDYLLNYAGTEINPEAIKTCENKGHKIISNEIEVEKYDMVVSYQVFEHVNNAKEMINYAKKFIKEGGYLVLSIPNSNGFLKDVYNILDLPPHHSLGRNLDTFKYLDELGLELIKYHEEKITYPHYVTFLKKVGLEFGTISKFNKIIYNIQNLVAVLFAKILYQNSNLPKGHSLIGLFKLKE